MAMTMNGQVQLPASREVVWAKLNDPEVLKSCIPGCELLEMNSPTEFQAIATVKVGPVKARWKGKVRLSDLDPPNRSWLARLILIAITTALILSSKAAAASRHDFPS